MMNGEFAFPFKTGTAYFLGELKAFEAGLRERRAHDKYFGNLLRVPKGRANRWMGQRQKELAPLIALARQAGWSDDGTFILMSTDSQVDIRVCANGETFDLQFTLAAPQFGGYGYQQHLIVKALNECECVSGYPPYSIDEDGIAHGVIGVLRDEDRWGACFAGLSRAIANKALYDGRGCVLAVLAQEFYLQLLEPARLWALVETVLIEHALSFESVCIFDHQPGFIVELGEASFAQSGQSEREGR